MNVDQSIVGSKLEGMRKVFVIRRVFWRFLVSFFDEFWITEAETMEREA